MKRLDQVQGGASRVTSRSGGGNDQLVQMLTQVTQSIQSLANQQNKGMDPMMMMMMMMMMGGGGGGGGGGVVPAGGGYPPGASAQLPMPVINITTDVKRGCR